MTNSDPYDTISAAQDAVETSRERLAEGLKASARAVRKAADSLPLGDKMAHFAGRAAEGLNQSARYVGEHKTEELVEDARGVVRRHPGESLIVAAAVGLAIGWVLRE